MATATSAGGCVSFHGRASRVASKSIAEKHSFKDKSYRRSRVIANAHQREQQEHKVLGGLDFIYSQKSGVEEELFKGKGIGVDADIASLDFRETSLRSLKHLDGGYHVPQRFKERIGVHFAKNFTAASFKGSVPLILGVWGKKGCGKSFNIELCCLEMGVTPVIVSAGELEDEIAGMPGLRIRDRYLQAAELMHNQGKPSCMIVNDVDAGLGRLQGAQTTVNNQNCQGTLMNLCDNPHEVSVGKAWNEYGDIPRVPIIITANDLSVLYAPLLRDGRMDKFYWEPEPSELAQMLAPLYDLPEEQCSELIDAFPGQPLDFFGAIKSRLVDNDVRVWMQSVGYSAIGDKLTGDSSWQSGEKFKLDTSGYTFEDMLKAGHGLAAEQDAVMNSSLAREYFKRGWQSREEKAAQEEQESQSLRRANEAAERWSSQPVLQTSGKGSSSNDGTHVGLEEELLTKGGVTMREALALQAEEMLAREQKLAEETQHEAMRNAAAGWRTVDPIMAKDMLDKDSYTYVDIRSLRDFNRDSFKDAVHIPSFEMLGFGLDADTQFLESFAATVQDQYSSTASKLLLVGGDEEIHTETAVNRLLDLGYSELAAINGGYTAWSKVFRTNGQRRVFGKWGDPTSDEHDYWTASN